MHYLATCWFSFKYKSLLLRFDDDEEIKPLPRNSSSLSNFKVWFCVILSNSVRYELRMSLWRVCVCIWAVPLSGSWAILSFNKVNFDRQSFISKLIVSYENSLDKRGDDSPVPFPDDILLNATSFKSISFSRFLAFFRISIKWRCQINKCKFWWGHKYLD